MMVYIMNYQPITYSTYVVYRSVLLRLIELFLLPGNKWHLYPAFLLFSSTQSTFIQLASFTHSNTHIQGVAAQTENANLLF